MLNFIKNNLKYIIVLIVIPFICFFEFPYYIDVPGGMDNINDKVKIENGYEAEGSINLTYVGELKATLPLLIIAKFNPDWSIEKKEKKSDNSPLDYDEIMIRQKALMKQSYSTAIKVAFEKADKKVDVIEEKCHVIYVMDNADTDLKIGDQIKKIDDKTINKCDDIDDIKSSKKENDESIVEVVNNGKTETKKVKYIKYKDSLIMGIELTKEFVLETEPKYSFKYSNDEYGPSGGLMITLAVYNSLVKEDITHGKKIAGTGTISEHGNVGPIGGVDYKLKSAVKGKADVFFVPSGDNYEEAIKLKDKKNYKIDIVAIETFDEALEYLNKLAK